MASNFFIDKKLKKKIEKDIKKRNDIEDKIHRLQEELKKVEGEIDEDIEKFYKQTDDATVLSTISHCENNSGKKKKEIVKEIEKRFMERNIIIEDTLKLTDWYEDMCNDYNDKI